MMYNKNIILKILIMPRYKLSPEERAAEKERKENLRNIMKGLDVKNFDDLKDVFKMMVGEMLENGLDGELDDELGYTKYDFATKREITAVTGILKRPLKQASVKRKSKCRETETVNLSRSLLRKIKLH